MRRMRNGHTRVPELAGSRSATRSCSPRFARSIGPNLKALICGSAPLAVETQLFFMMLGIPVLQVYGLTETTAICTMDDPAASSRATLGPAIPGIEMKVGENGEILVRGPNIFPGYWHRPQKPPKRSKADGFTPAIRAKSDRERKLAHHRAHEESDYSEFRPQHRAGADRRRSLLRALPDAQQVVLRRQSAQLSGGARVTSATAEWQHRRRERCARFSPRIDAVNAALPHYKTDSRVSHAARTVHHRKWIADDRSAN